MEDAYYHRRHLGAFPRIGEGQPELARAFFAYYGAVFEDGAMSVREKSLAALAVSHVVQCPYCIDAYTSGSLEAGADLEQMTEAVHVAAAVRAQSTLAYGLQMVGQATQLGMGQPATAVTDTYFSRRHGADRSALGTEASALARSHQVWEAETMADGALSTREKHLVALACAHVLQCPYSIEAHTKALREEGAGLDEMTEAVHVATAIRGGASLVHGIQMLEQLEQSSM